MLSQLALAVALVILQEATLQKHQRFSKFRHLPFEFSFFFFPFFQKWVIIFLLQFHLTGLKSTFVWRLSPAVD